MPELTLESLNARLAEVERLLAAQSAAPAARKKDWRRTVGMFTGSEFMKQVDAEGQAVRDADRAEARSEPAS
jgi:hypothetical protein